MHSMERIEQLASLQYYQLECHQICCLMLSGITVQYVPVQQGQLQLLKLW